MQKYEAENVSDCSEPRQRTHLQVARYKASSEFCTGKNGEICIEIYLKYNEIYGKYVEIC